MSAEATEELTGVSADTIDTTSDLADAFADAATDADAFSSALDQIIGRHLDVVSAQRDLEAGLDDLTATLIENGNTWDINTEADRANGEALQGSVENVLGLAEAELRAGATTEEATVEMLRQRDVLINEVAEALGITTEEAAVCVNQLGLTPTAISTAVELAGDEVAKQRIEAHRAELGEIPEGVATAVEVAINQGDYDRAERLLEQLERTRWMTLRVQYGGPAARGPGLAAVPVAYGGYFEGNNPIFGVMGEAPWDEAMLTVGNMANLRRQLMDDRISGPILEALPMVDVHDTGAGGSWRGRVRDVSVQRYGQTVTPASVAAAIRMVGVSR